MDEEWREADKVAEERGDVGVGEVLVDVDFAEQTLDGVEMVVGLRLREVVEGLSKGSRVSVGWQVELE